jgi:hypothetical protein
MYESTYTHCDATWIDVYECPCNSDCPVCGQTDIEPVSYIKLSD